MEFHHVGISVADIDRSIAFYRDGFGMALASPTRPIGGGEVEAVMGLRDVAARSAMLVRGTLAIELFEFASPMPAAKDPDYSVADRGISHFGVTVPDIAAACAHMAAHGARFHSTPRLFEGGARATYGRDPDGNVFELLEMPN